jgi:hypothetical protein
MKWIKSLFAKIFIARTEALLIATAEAVVTTLVKNGGPVLVQIARDAVAAAEAAGGSGESKKAAAVATVIAGLKTRGIPVVQNAVQLAVESAVAQIKANL